MALIILKWIVIILAVLNFGYMLFDGSRALIKGDYIRPTEGEYAGQLGPWNGIVKFIGIDPQSTLMKMIFVLWGLMGIILTICFGLNYQWAWKALLIMNICLLWYLWMGTGLSIIQIILLIVILFLK